ncbi:PREDICTED: uncharacterized protein LOC109239051 [Nicotiana attenuata]|uniref:uncharacterized protein LOC109239051 n=1 Tax=Nicotiana attenuata TaxID=49451 RepID=UPI0009055685|nr:PREDICTED: uncharacterized protein LOC109239051 [Nicotiana attenuata]
MVTKSIIANLNKDEHNTLEGINHVLSQQEHGNTAQHKRDLEAYKAWKRVDSIARGIIVSSMVDELIRECEEFPNAYAMWAHLRGTYGGTSVTRLRQLTIKFDTFKKRHDKSIKQHLRVMSNMIVQLKSVGHVLSDEQKVQGNLTHNESIKTFPDVARHVELEDERLGAAKAASNTFVAESSGKKSSGFKRKKNWKKKGKDSGSTDHVSRDREEFVEFRRVSPGSSRNGVRISLDNVLYGFGLRYDRFIILDCNLSTYDYYVDRCVMAYYSSNNDIDVITWHARLGHIGQDRMNRLANEVHLGSFSKIDMPTCENCLAGKITRKPFGKAKRVVFPFQLIHSDICGPMNVRSRFGAAYFIIFIDDFTRFGYVYLISHKSEALECFKRYMNEVENQLDKSIKVLRTDRRREYLSKQFEELCTVKGIIRQLTTPYTPQQK